MRIRAQASGDKVTVRVLMSHEMESGQRKDASGKLVPAWHIQDVTASLNGKPVFSCEWGPAVSKNPFLQFAIKGAKAGDERKIEATFPVEYPVADLAGKTASFDVKVKSVAELVSKLKDEAGVI